MPALDYVGLGLRLGSKGGASQGASTVPDGHRGDQGRGRRREGTQDRDEAAAPRARLSHGGGSTKQFRLSLSLAALAGQGVRGQPTRRGLEWGRLQQPDPLIGVATPY